MIHLRDFTARPTSRAAEELDGSLSPLSNVSCAYCMHFVAAVVADLVQQSNSRLITHADIKHCCLPQNTTHHVSTTSRPQIAQNIVFYLPLMQKDRCSELPAIIFVGLAITITIIDLICGGSQIRAAAAGITAAESCGGRLSFTLRALAASWPSRELVASSLSWMQQHEFFRHGGSGSSNPPLFCHTEYEFQRREITFSSAKCYALCDRKALDTGQNQAIQAS